jgi:lipopolysaccharide exporter
MDEVPPPERPTSGLTRHTLKGLQWAYLGTAIGGVLQFGMTMIMARLLTPTAFGLIALAGLFLRFVDYFAKAGITQALVQKASLAADDIRAAFTLSAGLGAAFALVVLAGAPLAAQLVREPDLTPVLRWLSVGLLLHGLGAPSVALLRRGLRFRELALIEIGSYVVGYIGVGLIMALNGAGVYALVAAMLTQGGVNAASAYQRIRHPIAPSRVGASYRVILAFGARVSLVGFFEFLKSSLDTLAIGRWAGSAQLGLYNRAKVLAELPSYQLMQGLSKVLFPSFSAIQLEHKRLKKAYLSAVGAATAILAPLNAGMAVAAPEIILVVLGPQWVGAADVLPWLLLAFVIAMTGHFAGIVAEAQAALNAKLLIAVTSTVALAGLLWFAQGRPLATYGAAVAVSTAVSHIGYVAILTRTLDTSFRSLVQPYARSILGAGVVAAAVAGARLVLLQLDAPVILVLAGEILTGAVALGLMLRIGPLRVFRDDLANRLADAGMMGPGSSRMGRLVQFFVGPPSKHRS